MGWATDGRCPESLRVCGSLVIFDVCYTSPFGPMISDLWRRPERHLVPGWQAEMRVAHATAAAAAAATGGSGIRRWSLHSQDAVDDAVRTEPLTF